MKKKDWTLDQRKKYQPLKERLTREGREGAWGRGGGGGGSGLWEGRRDREIRARWEEGTRSEGGVMGEEERNKKE